MNTTKRIEPRLGSDDDMRQWGFHRATSYEQARYGRHVNRESTFSILMGLFHRLGLPDSTKRVVPQANFVVWQTAGSTSSVVRRSSRRPHIGQTPESSIAGFVGESDET